MRTTSKRAYLFYRERQSHRPVRIKYRRDPSLTLFTRDEHPDRMPVFTARVKRAGIVRIKCRRDPSLTLFTRDEHPDRMPVLPRTSITPGRCKSPPRAAIQLSIRGMGRADLGINERYLGSAAPARLPGRPTAIHAASRHLPSCLVQTVMTRFWTSAMRPLLSARRCICSSTMAVSP